MPPEHTDPVDIWQFIGKIHGVKMKIVCAWCHKVMKEYESHKNLVSHGICPECLRGLIGATDINLGDFLDRIDVPVLLTDGAVIVQRANRKAELEFGRQSTKKLTNATVGVAIECLNAQGTGECGRAEKCVGCVLRGTILGTHADGKPRYGQYSQNQVMTPLGAKPKRFRFSTTRVGDAVMLSIEEVLDLATASQILDLPASLPDGSRATSRLKQA